MNAAQSPPVSSLSRKWHDFWFAPESPTTLGIGRMVFFLGVLIFHVPRDLADWVHVPLSMWNPTWIFRVMNWGVVDDATLGWMMIAWTVSLFFAGIGFFTRISAMISFALGLYLLGLPNNFGKTGHGDPALLLLMLILAIARSGDAISVDAFIRRKRGRPAPAPSGEYRWPIRMAWTLLAIILCSAGCTKIVRSGLTWVTSDNFAIYLLQHRYALSDPPMGSVAGWIVKRAWRCHTLAAGAVGLEILFPLALVYPRLRKIFVPGALLMQIGIGLLMGVYFTQWLLLYQFWIPWEKVIAWVGRRKGSVTFSPADDTAQASNPVVADT